MRPSLSVGLVEGAIQRFIVHIIKKQQPECCLNSSPGCFDWRSKIDCHFRQREYLYLHLLHLDCWRVDYLFDYFMDLQISYLLSNYLVNFVRINLLQSLVCLAGQSLMWSVGLCCYCFQTDYWCLDWRYSEVDFGRWRQSDYFEMCCRKDHHLF